MIPLITAVAIAVGLTLDATLPYWGHWAANAFVFTCFLAVFRRATPEERKNLVACVALATLGELFLCYGWGLYEYKYGDIPLFVPLGHSIIFLSGCRLAPKLPRLVTPAVVTIAGAFVVLLAATGVDTAGLLWFPMFLACLAIPGNRHLYGVMFAMAFVVELAGTSVGSWWWFDEVPLFGLRSTNPPLCAGVFYCVLDVLVLGVERIAHARRAANDSTDMFTGLNQRRRRRIVGPADAGSVFTPRRRQSQWPRRRSRVRAASASAPKRDRSS